MTETNTVVNAIRSFKSISGELAAMSKTTRALQDQLKSLQRVVKQSESGRVKQKRPQVKMALSKDLQKFLARDKGTTLTKAEVMKSVSNYIKEKNLQIQEDKRSFFQTKNSLRSSELRVKQAT